MDLYLLAWTPKGYKAVIKKIYKELKEDLFGVPPEILFRASLEQKQAEIKVVPRFKLAPLVDASRGWDGQNFSSGRNLIKFYIRNFVYRFIPGLWI
jgi:hypothetical protein